MVLMLVQMSPEDARQALGMGLDNPVSMKQPWNHHHLLS